MTRLGQMIYDDGMEKGLEKGMDNNSHSNNVTDRTVMMEKKTAGNLYEPIARF